MILTAEKLKITMVQQSARRPTRHILHGTRTASVAAIFACPSTKATDPLELLFIRRAINPRDRWSGHIAFPGGRVEAGESALDAARRETMEEVGVDLTHAEVLGQLDDRLAARNGLVVHTFVFLLATKPSTCVLQPLEVSDVLWVSSLALADAPLRTLFYPIGPYLQRAVPRCLHPILANLPLGSVTFPCLYLPHPSTDVVRIDRQAHEYVLWGVTYSMYLDIRVIVSRRQYPPDAKSAAPSYVALYYRLLVSVVLVVVALAFVSWWRY
ncbi:hypothetical protein H257_02641 [Aphanomyces astaci]|uniref:Nudix hydrolase domain-containing protein n=1 Tax=Aphanomyces astaci TaxID=112090 RepID=W4H3N5_APHAT|nr:hypothetical protein H257_02641 [Aphanomyces astaci]ETV86201.1 hypothetical protein H257_02641 [Aphanomyces astaci]|eukprot:XP_009824673.1 hypothetical protein H257_02641 [Aphanomyces astaci]